MIGKWMQRNGIEIIFEVKGIVMEKVLVKFNLVESEMIKIMKEKGKGDEEEEIQIGESGWKELRYVKLKKIKWGMI